MIKKDTPITTNAHSLLNSLNAIHLLGKQASRFVDLKGRPLILNPTRLFVVGYMTLVLYINLRENYTRLTMEIALRQLHKKCLLQKITK